MKEYLLHTESSQPVRHASAGLVSQMLEGLYHRIVAQEVHHAVLSVSLTPNRLSWVERVGSELRTDRFRNENGMGQTIALKSESSAMRSPKQTVLTCYSATTAFSFKDETDESSRAA